MCSQILYVRSMNVIHTYRILMYKYIVYKPIRWCTVCPETRRCAERGRSLSPGILCCDWRTLLGKLRKD